MDHGLKALRADFVAAMGAAGLLFLGLAANPAAADDAQTWVAAHNAYRAKHCVPALTWSPPIAASAQAWANQCTRQHDQSSGLGENLFWGTAGAYSPQAAMQSWYAEIGAYNYAAPGFSTKTGHFTQVIWRGSTQLGCAMAACGGFDYWVCRYSPPGNVTGAFPANVPEPGCEPVDLQKFDILQKNQQGVGDILKQMPKPVKKLGKLKITNVLQDVDVYPAPGGEGTPIGALVSGDKAVVVGCADTWCHITKADPARVPGGDGWVYDADDYDSLDR